MSHVRCVRAYAARHLVFSSRSRLVLHEPLKSCTVFGPDHLGEARSPAPRRISTRCSHQSVEAESTDPAIAVRVPDASLGREIDVAPLGECCHFVNLTNGLEALPCLTALALPYQFCRIQSTFLEQQKYEQLILQADSGLMMAMASNQTCLVWDFGSRNKKRGVPRAIWYGLEFLRYAAMSTWLGGSGNIAKAFLRGYDTSKDFDFILNNLSKAAKNKLRYYIKFVPADMTEVKLYGVFDVTANDSDVHVYRTLAHTYLLPSSPAPPEGGALPPSLSPYVRQRVFPTMDCDRLLWGPPRPALNVLGFSLFHGGVCHSVVNKQGGFYSTS